MAIDLTGVREAIEGISSRVTRLKTAIDALQSVADNGGLQDEIDAIKTRAEEISQQLDDLIADAEGEEGGETETPPTDNETPVVNPL